MYRNTFVFPLVSLLLLLCGCYSGGNRSQSEETSSDWPSIKEKGEITAVTLNSSTSYFQYKMQAMGYEYDLIADFARQNGLRLNMKVAENITRLMEMLQSGEADVAAYPITIDNKLKEQMLFCGYERQSNLVIVQRAGRGDTVLTDVTQLIGKEVCIKPYRRYQERLENLNSELGGGIRIVHIDKDTISSEDLIEMVAKGLIDYTVCEDDVARLNRTYYRNININLAISFKQRSSWAVRKNCPKLAKAIHAWASNITGKSSYQSAIKRYFELSKVSPTLIGMPKIANGQISPYDDLFKRYAGRLGWDWRLLASIAYQESRFQPQVVAWSGAEGLMGIMPATARGLGFDAGEMQNPEKNVQAAIECLRRFGKGFVSLDSLERIKLTLASYNAGIGHIYDAQRLAQKYGRNPNVWNDNVAEFIRLKAEAQYYTDSVCKFGYLRGTETYNYVSDVLNRYEYYRKETESLENR